MPVDVVEVAVIDDVRVPVDRVIMVGVTDQHRLESDLIFDDAFHSIKKGLFHCHDKFVVCAKSRFRNFGEIVFVQQSWQLIGFELCFAAKRRYLFCRAIRGQPNVELFVQFVDVDGWNRTPRISRAVAGPFQLARRPPFDQRVFVDDFDHDDGRLVCVGRSCVRVHVSQQVSRVFLLQFDQTRIKMSRPLSQTKRFRIRNSIACFVGPERVEIQVRVDSSQLN